MTGQVGGGGGGDGVQDGGADGGADLLGHVGGRAGGAGVSRVGFPGGGGEQGHDRQAQSQPDEQFGGQYQSGVAGGRGDLGEQGGPGRADEQPGDHDGPGGDPRQEPAGDLGRGQAVDHGQGQEPETGDQRGQVLDALQGVGEEQERPVVGEHGQGDRRVRAAPVAAGEDPQRKQRVGERACTATKTASADAAATSG